MTFPLVPGGCGVGTCRGYSGWWILLSTVHPMFSCLSIVSRQCQYSNTPLSVDIIPTSDFHLSQVLRWHDDDLKTPSNHSVTDLDFEGVP